MKTACNYMISLNMKKTNKLENQVSNFAKLEHGKFLNKNKKMLNKKVWAK